MAFYFGLVCKFGSVEILRRCRFETNQDTLARPSWRVNAVFTLMMFVFLLLTSLGFMKETRATSRH